MCGIAGIVSLGGPPPLLQELQAMTAVLRHRGPDSAGCYLGAHAGLAMRRLSIIDLETGSQPVRNEDGSVWTVFNGEIYNFRELRAELETKGHRFATRTDTETIVHLYEEHGVRCVDRLRGMFAFALWDAARRRLLLARDRLGIKPLFYAEAGGRLIFASELKAILQLPDIPRGLHWGAVDHLFTNLVTPPAQSIVAGVRKLEPGHVLVASPHGVLHQERYWEFRIEPDRSKPPAYFEERLRELLEESVRLHLVSDVPLGAFLSGGVDSSAVVSTMTRVAPGNVTTFSIGFPESGYDESPYASLVAQTLGTEHVTLTIRPDVLESLEDLAWHLDEPFGDPSAIPTYKVSQLASEHVKVVLSGDGGDELFGGYDKYRVERRERVLRRLPAAARKALGAAARHLPEGARGRNFLRHFSLDETDRYLDASTLFRREQKERLFRREVLELTPQEDSLRAELAALRRRSAHWLSPLQALDVNRYLPLDILTKVDRMSMAHSLEARVPLLDHKLVEFAGTIPPEWNLRGGQGKWLFKRALRGIVPPAVLERPKHGFAIPLGKWFRGRLHDFVKDLLLSETARNRGIFDPTYVERLVGWHQAGRELDLHLWTLLSFELWCRTFLDGSPARELVPGPGEMASVHQGTGSPSRIGSAA